MYVVCVCEWVCMYGYWIFNMIAVWIVDFSILLYWSKKTLLRVWMYYEHSHIDTSINHLFYFFVFFIPAVEQNGWKSSSHALANTCTPIWPPVNVCGIHQRVYISSAQTIHNGGSCSTRTPNGSTTTMWQRRQLPGIGRPIVTSYHWRSCNVSNKTPIRTMNAKRAAHQRPSLDYRHIWMILIFRDTRRRAAIAVRVAKMNRDALTSWAVCRIDTTAIVAGHRP